MSNNNNRIKDIVEGGIHQGYSRNHIIGNICFEIATKEEKQAQLITWDYTEETTNKAEALLEKYRTEYYNNIKSK